MVHEPEFLLKYFPDLQCAANAILKKIHEAGKDASAATQDNNADIEDDISTLKSLLRQPPQRLHALAVVQTQPSLIMRRKYDDHHLSPEESLYYNENVVCADTFRLCALTKGQSSNLR